MARPLDELVAVVARLRSPKGCPWDREQTHKSLIKYLREEAKEVEGAIKKGAWHEIEDELGDLLLQVLLHAQIAQDNGQFDIQDVARSQALKLRRRHPHVFGSREFKSAEEVLRHWGAIKAGERNLRRRDVDRRLKASRAAGAPRRFESS